MTPTISFVKEPEAMLELPNTNARTYAAAREHLDAVAEVGVSYDDVMATLESEGIEKFDASWRQLVASVDVALVAARSGRRDSASLGG